MNFPVDSWLEACGWGLGSLACASALLIVVLLRRKQKHVADKHVLITGGSEGLGLELAKECVRRGARRVTIVGRREGKLREAVRSLEMTRDNFYEKEMGVTRKSDKGPLCTVSHFSVDCCDETAVKKLFSQLESEGDSPQVVVCNVGAAVARLFGDLQASDFRRMMEVNFLSSVYVAQSAVPLMKKAGGGMLMFVSSQAGQVAVGGYSAYSASKFALRGFSEVLQMELEPLGIQVSTVYPPSIDTPGYVEEQKGKPSLTQQIEADSGLWSADTVARVSVQGFESGRSALIEE
uniref:3-dehydrosphinganine reductase n=1 Tax=Chromera velia CCMP2878 TaxID=1169474 RepID=A0A0G4HEW0_9ALVE|eukprot:Cvel_26746.t1-p1 / transcript=Cvel_26746.t1 / gene=Cvel_26746 / organism=Chromera_velia_CCMP2878 / gene_product=3-ketodihydrosphingosine reductase, putative / transcript_product=3-ketodihydrosphingosine reductase, putative / location=Cvel_scaffold3230:688-1855(-) / protein_length=291 / sequence_SO=supercontig / SO=protein_coding / is_pseudo=false